MKKSFNIFFIIQEKSQKILKFWTDRPPILITGEFRINDIVYCQPIYLNRDVSLNRLLKLNDFVLIKELKLIQKHYLIENKDLNIKINLKT